MAKMEREMEEVFERKVREKRQKLADSQADLEKRHKESKDKLESQKRELEAKMSAFEQEKVCKIIMPLEIFKSPSNVRYSIFQFISLL